MEPNRLQCAGSAPASLLWLGDGAHGVGPADLSVVAAKGVGPADIAGVARVQGIRPADSILVMRGEHRPTPAVGRGPLLE